jgi:hypothetical protein
MKDNGGGDLGQPGSGSITRQSTTREITSPVNVRLPVPGLTRTMSDKAVAKEKKPWNTKNLLPRVGVDIAAGCCAAASVAPIITTIDRL